MLFAIILFVSQPKENEANRWMIVFCLSGAVGAFQNWLINSIIPTLQDMNVVFMSKFLFQLHIYFHFLGQTVSPYAVLMYALVYSQVVKVKTKKKLSYILTIPMISMIFFTDFYPDIKMNFQVLLILVTPYFLIASYLMFRTWRSEINIYKKQNKFRALIVLVPAWLSVYVFNNIFGAIDTHQQLFRFIPVFFFLAYVLFVVYIFLHGAFGIKVKVEQQQILDKSMKIMSEGTAILNHTIKNEVSKIKFFLNIAQNSVEQKDLHGAGESIDATFSAIQGIDDMVDRIRAKTEEIVPKETEFNLIKLIEKCIQGARSVASSKGIQINTQFEVDVILKGDTVLLAETINNILNNAMEAIVIPEGIIHIELFLMKNKGISIEISDNGKGIPEEQLSRILEPYFSTKNNIKNHGLGLSLCYKIIRAHDGELSVHSEIGKGTSIIIQIPKSRIITEKVHA
ncbi:ATP-binding protein [Priestia megaterium]|uniref:sensor histidine kinase n=1 Tax=Priestia megaterium TaxID=1404 RepID=UPI002282A221|nr:sensor histidine kinase [Priestia megaterium]MCY9024089.1 ATP-binding protein [Priestia megaterium]